MKDFKEYTREKPDKEILSRLISYIQPHKKRFILVLIMMLISIVVQLIPSLIIGITIDVVISETLSIAEKLNYLVYLGAGFALLMVAAFNIEYRQSLWLQEIGQKIILTMRQEVFEHIQTLGPSQRLCQSQFFLIDCIEIKTYLQIFHTQ